LHLYVQLPSGFDESGLVEDARRRGLHIEGASWHFSDARSAPPALVLGYGSIDEAAIRSGLALLGSVYDERRQF
jgi:GntR family transcriptional regulator/MocR family aminotransferase